MVGQIFHELTVIKKVGKSWLCRCSCGNEVIATGCRLRSGRTQRCPACVAKNKSSHDLTGRKFGKLTVISKAEVKNKWVVKCDCGNTEETFTQMLTTGEKHQCAECTRRQRKKDLSGQTIGNLIVNKLVEKDNDLQWACTCTCGEHVVVKTNYLLNPKAMHMCPTCTQREVTKRLVARNKARAVHAHSDHPLYPVWWKMITEHRDHVCTRWTNNDGLEHFIVDMSPRPPSMMLARVDVNADYSPTNCKWVTKKQWARTQRRTTRMLTVNGVTKAISDWADEAGVSTEAIAQRLRRGMSPEMAVLKGSLATKAGRRKLKRNGVKINNGGGTRKAIVDHPYTVTLDGKQWSCIRVEDHPLINNLIGQTFGTVSVVALCSVTVRHDAMWLCKCTCGHVFTLNRQKLTSGNCHLCPACAKLTVHQRGVIDETGHVYGELTVIAKAGVNAHRRAVWHCKCSCGREVDVTGEALRRGNTRSCGHLVSVSNRRDGTRKAMYTTWRGMHRRCEDPTHPSYATYGGRGIKVCDRWSGEHGFEHFMVDVEPRPCKGLTLDRTNNDGDYEPGNVRWVDKTVQANNTKRNRRLTWNGETLTVAQWAHKLHIPDNELRGRLRNGWSVERALTTPFTTHHVAKDDGGLKSRRELYSTWYQMHQRCENPKATGYKNYGGRGIKVCDRWSGKTGFNYFILDMSPRPANTSLDRINNDGDYEPSNCRWADITTQALNRRNTRTYTVNGVTKSVTAWAKEVGVAPQTIVDRIASGFPPDVVLAKVSLASKEGRALLRANGVDVHTGAPKGSVLVDHPYTVRMNGKAYTCIRPDDHPQVPDLIGQTFGQLTVKGMLPGLPVKWLCQCTCGVVRLASTRDLRESVVTACRQCSKTTARKRSGRGGVIDETGHVYGELTVVGRAEDKPGRGTMWTCRCSCGRTVVVNGNLLRKGWTRSCGHLKRSVADQRTRSTWMSMVKRCTDANDPAYTHYGARGVTVCDRWLGLDGLAHFVADMGPRPAGCTLDRIDPAQGYSPSNCRWATAVQQARNKRTTVRVKYQGMDLPVADWAERVDLPAEVVRTRLRRGWTVEAALTTPYRRRRKKDTHE